MTAPIDVMSIRKLGEYNSEIRGPAGKQVTLGEWASAIFIPDTTVFTVKVDMLYVSQINE